MLELMQQYHIDGIIHLAAESHVDRSIKDPFTFARTNVMGTLSLLQAAKVYWESLPEKYEGKRFYHISTDEVYGALEMTHPEGIEPPFTTTASSAEHHLAYGKDFFYEDTKYNPHSPTLPARQAVTTLCGHSTIRTACDHRDELFEQLRAVSVPGEADSAVHQQHSSPQAAAGIRQGGKCARLAVCGGPCAGYRRDFPQR